MLDISRWLEEHPGGSTIIPSQALNVDCTVFFEIYHASRQSFLYLKEFYIGELHEDDYQSVPGMVTRRDRSWIGKDEALSEEKKVGSDRGHMAGPSEAFLEQLRRVTSWRLTPDDLINYDVHKSF